MPWDLRYKTLHHSHPTCSPRAGGSERMFDLNEVEGASRDGIAGCCGARWTVVRVPGFTPHAAVLKCLKGVSPYFPAV